jgi:hypothetical protein
MELHRIDSRKEAQVDVAGARRNGSSPGNGPVPGNVGALGALAATETAVAPVT